ncbi:MAG: acetyl-CoA carboxylase biotin carboxyl carrier protein [Anaerorhabdus sp.]
MDKKKVKDIIKLFEESTLSEMSLEVDDIKISMKKSDLQNDRVEMIPVVNSHVVNTSEEIIQEEKEIGDPIKSPLVGVFYASNVEGGKPLVSVGTKVKKGDLLCVIEAMKVMNEIHADRDGEVVKVLFVDNDTVQYGDVLMYIA